MIGGFLIPAPPKPRVGKAIAYFDTECFPNFWLLKFRPKGERAYSFTLRNDQLFTQAQADGIRALFDAYCAISFNGIYYDVPMITAALCGYSAGQLKWLNDKIIVEKLKPWELNLPEWKPNDHIDIMEVAPGQGSQKQYAARIHCKTMRDLPYNPDHVLNEAEIVEVETYCENDLDVLEALHDALQPHLRQREKIGERYGIDVRSKSDAQVAEAVLRKRCEQATGQRIYKPNVDWNQHFKYEVPVFIKFQLPELQHALEQVCLSVFGFNAAGQIDMPSHLKGLTVTINQSKYTLGIGGLHSNESCVAYRSDANWTIRDNDVAAYYPSLILNSGKWPESMGPTFLSEYGGIKAERIAGKTLQAKLKKAGDTSSVTYEDAKADNEGGKIMINGTFGKTGSPYSVLFAPSMLIQTTITGQLSLLMLIERHEIAGIPVISANTDGVVIMCPRHLVAVSESIIAQWQRETGLEMETVEYAGIYSRDVNTYFAVKTDGDVKRKGEVAKSGLDEKKNPDVEICSDAVAEYLAKGTSIIKTIVECRDIRKFVTIQRVNGGGVKMWGEGAQKDTKVSEMIPTLLAKGWVKEGRKWKRGDVIASSRDAYEQCFEPQRPEYLGKVVRWYYSTQAPGPIVYHTNGNCVGLSYGGKPCMTLPDEFPDDIDYDWYVTKAQDILDSIGLQVSVWG